MLIPELHNTGINMNQNFTEFYQILRILWTTRQLVMNDRATYMWLSGQV
jgi:hypothetical protein